MDNLCPNSTIKKMSLDEVVSFTQSFGPRGVLIDDPAERQRAHVDGRLGKLKNLLNKSMSTPGYSILVTILTKFSCYDDMIMYIVEMDTIENMLINKIMIDPVSSLFCIKIMTRKTKFATRFIAAGLPFLLRLAAHSTIPGCYGMLSSICLNLLKVKYCDGMNTRRDEIDIYNCVRIMLTNIIDGRRRVYMRHVVCMIYAITYLVSEFDMTNIMSFVKSIRNYLRGRINNRGGISKAIRHYVRAHMGLNVILANFLFINDVSSPLCAEVAKFVLCNCETGDLSIAADDITEWGCLLLSDLADISSTLVMDVPDIIKFIFDFVFSGYAKDGCVENGVHFLVNVLENSDQDTIGILKDPFDNLNISVIQTFINFGRISYYVRCLVDVASTLGWETADLEELI